MAAMLDRIPWRAEETVVVAAPMFHAWGFGQLVDLRDADLHGRHAPEVRPRGDAGDGARAPAPPGSASSR